MAWLHTWSGLLPGWVMFLVFLFGTAAFFDHEISAWMRPELRSAHTSTQALDAANSLLLKEAPGATGWMVALPSNRGGEPLAVSWSHEGADGVRRGHADLDPSTGQKIVVRDTRGGSFLYAFHYNLHYIPAWLGEYVVLIASLAMLLAIMSGVMTHKKIFADFFMLRFGRGQRSWLDAHNVAGVLALPFHIMITYTGLVTLLFALFPWALSANFGSEHAFADAAFPHPQVEASGRPAPIVPLRELIARSHAVDAAFVPQVIWIGHPGDAGSLVTVKPSYDALPSRRSRLYLDGTTGEVLQSPHQRGAGARTASAMVDLHAGLFAAPALRWLYFLSGVAGTVLIASGLVLWTVKRRARLPDPAHPHPGFRLVERLNIGVMAGATAAMAVYFLANRLLPIDMADRADWEINAMFITWAALFLWSILRPAKRAWIETLAAGALLHLLIPVINALTTERGLVPSLIAGDRVFAGFDLVALATATALALAAWKMATRKAGMVPRRKTVEAAA